MSTTGLDAATLARSLRRMAGDGSVEWVIEPIQASVLRDIADLLDEIDKLRRARQTAVNDALAIADMLINAQADKDRVESENVNLYWNIASLEAALEGMHLIRDQDRDENAKLRELLRYNGAVIEACTGEILDHIGVPYIVGPAGVAQALMEATAMLVHKRYDFDPPSFYKEDK